MKANGRGMAVALVSLTALWGTGCDSQPVNSLVEVQGTVTYNGKPVPCGMVVFATEDGSKRGVAPVGRDGSFKMKSPTGKVKGAVVFRPADQSADDPNRPAVRDVFIPPGIDLKSLPPEKYERFDTSGLTFEIKEDGQTVNIPLN